MFNAIKYKYSLGAVFVLLTCCAASLIAVDSTGIGAVMVTTEVASVNAGPRSKEAQSSFEVQQTPNRKPDSTSFVRTDSVIYKEKIAQKKEYTFKDVNKEAWLVNDAAAKAKPYLSEKGILDFDKYDKVTLTGVNDLEYHRIEVDGKSYYLHKDHYTTDYSVVEELQEEDKRREEGLVDWDGPVLTPSRGVNYGPSGKETYYNLDMSGVISIMRGIGNTDEYWVREDGCKMLGNYIMVAADLSVHPRGSLIPTSLGIGIVSDTGGFVTNGSGTCVDIATDW